MTRVIEWLLNLERISLQRDAPLFLRWNAPLEAWLLFGLGLIAAVWILIHYRRERTSVARRIVLALLRGALVGLVLITLCEPALVLQRERIEPSYVAMLFDTSASMSQTDDDYDAAPTSAPNRATAPDARQDDAQPSRLEQGKRLVLRNDGALLRGMLASNGLQVSAFSSDRARIGTAWDQTQLDSLIESVSQVAADGSATDLVRAISDTIEEAEGRRLAAIVLLSDGRHTQVSALTDALQRAADRKIPIYPVRIGAPDPRFDVEVGPLRADETAFAHDILAIEAQVSLRGSGVSAPLTLRLIDEDASRVVATEEMPPPPDDTPMRVELRIKPARTGRISYRVEIEPLPRELFADNNADRVIVNVLNERVNVLYVEGAPRYEYRYLKNALVREPTVEVSVLLLEADEQFVQEGTDPIRRFPDDPSELDRYDIVIMGDIDPGGGWLSTAQMEMLVDFVGQRGGGFALIAGERYAPRHFADTPLEKLIPVRIDPTFLGRYEADLVNGFAPRLTEAGKASRLFRFSPDRDESLRMFDQLPRLYWIAQTLGPKPGATVLADHPDLATAFGPMPLIVAGRYGAGKLLIQATDDTWRWRRHTGEALHDAYWVHVVRELTAVGRLARDRRYAVRTDRKTYSFGSTVHVEVEVFDPELLGRQLDEFEVAFSALTVDEQTSWERSGASSGAIDRVGSVRVHRISEQSPVYEGSFVPGRPGRFVVNVTDIPSRLGEEKPHALLRVAYPDLEFRRPEADHETLKRIALATGGALVEPDQAEEVLLSIQDRSARIPDDIVEPLWDAPLILALFGLMITMEWLLRKAFGLV